MSICLFFIAQRRLKKKTALVLPILYCDFVLHADSET